MKENSREQRLYYIRGILRNRLSYLNEGFALQLLQEALDANASLESLERHAKKVRTWSEWRSDIEILLKRKNAGECSDIEAGGESIWLQRKKSERTLL